MGGARSGASAAADLQAGGLYPGDVRRMPEGPEALRQHPRDARARLQGLQGGVHADAVRQRQDGEGRRVDRGAREGDGAAVEELGAEPGLLLRERTGLIENLGEEVRRRVK